MAPLQYERDFLSPDQGVGTQSRVMRLRPGVREARDKRLVSKCMAGFDAGVQLTLGDRWIERG